MSPRIVYADYCINDDIPIIKEVWYGNSSAGFTVVSYDVEVEEGADEPVGELQRGDK